MSVLHLDSTSFEKLTSQSEKAVLIDFWATWCGPCQMMGPVLEELSEAHKEIIVGKVNVDEHPDLAQQMGIDTIPALFFYRNGQLVQKLIGYMDAETLSEKLDL